MSSLVVTLFVDADIFAFTFGVSSFRVNVDFFPGESSIFPSALLLAGCRNFSLYPSYCCCACPLVGVGVVSVRRREDTDRDGDSGVKVQIDGEIDSLLPCGSRESVLVVVGGSRV